MTVLTPGQTLRNGQYTIERELGLGRFSISYLAKCSDAQRWVIKVLNPQILGGLSDAERDRQESLFWQEAIKLSKCSGSHHIAKVEMPFKEGNLLCLPTEYLDCHNLAERAEHQLVEQTALNYIQQIGKALSVVHDQGLVHRDIRPANIQLKIRQGNIEAVLTNFELAVEVDTELTRTRKLELTDGFSPIELYSSAKNTGYAIKPYTDVYSLAATLYELLTGKVPCSARARKLDEQELISPQVYNPEISGKTTRAILKGMELLPEDRPYPIQEWLSLLAYKPKKQELPKQTTFATRKIEKAEPKRQGISHSNSVNWQTIWTALAVLVALLAGIPAWLALRPSNSPAAPQSTPTEQPSPQSVNRQPEGLRNEGLIISAMPHLGKAGYPFPSWEGQRGGLAVSASNRNPPRLRHPSQEGKSYHATKLSTFSVKSSSGRTS